MLLILEFVLTSYFCVRLERAKMGWGWGLLPIMAGLLAGVVFGFIVGALGLSVTIAVVLGAVTDLAVIAVLIVLCLITKPKSA